MPRSLLHNCKVSDNADVLFEQLIGLCKYIATQGFLLVPINWYQRIEWREINDGYRGFREFYIAFVSWVKVLLDFSKLGNFLSLHPVVPKTKIVVYFRQWKMIEFEENFFERYVTIVSVSVDIIEVLLFQLVSLFENLRSNF